MVSAVGRD